MEGIGFDLVIIKSKAVLLKERQAGRILGTSLDGEIIFLQSGCLAFLVW